jgi:glycosyltransferase involved in cell wall biosynthesis
MKAIFFHHGHARGGAAISLLFLLRQLKINKIDCDLVNTLCSSEVHDLYKSVCRNVISRRIWYYPHSTIFCFNLGSINGIIGNIKWLLLYPVSCVSMFSCLFKGGYDIVHFNSGTLITYGWIPRLMGVKLICHIREPFSPGKFGFRRNLLRWLLRLFSSHCIAICEDNAEDTRLLAYQVSVIYNPVDFEQFDNCRVDKKSSRDALNIPSGAFVTLFAGGSNATVKGVCDYIRAMNIVVKSVPDLICLMPSFSKDRLDEEEALQCLNRLGDRIIRSNFVLDIEKWISASDVVYALHQTPHFSRTIMEAGAMKRVVIATDIPGISEVLSDGYNGILCPVGDIDSVIQATLKIHDDVELTTRLGEGGYEQASRLFRVEPHGKAVKHVYHRVLG